MSRSLQPVRRPRAYALVSLLAVFGCADSGQPGGRVTPGGTSVLLIEGASIALEPGERRVLSVLDNTEPLTWDLSSESAGTLEFDGDDAILFAGASGVYTVTAQRVADPAVQGSATIEILDFEYDGRPDAFVLPVSSAPINVFRGRGIAATSEGLYLAETLCGQYSRFSKRALDGSGEAIFYELPEPSWPPSSQLHIRNLAVGPTGTVYLFVGVPLTGVDCSQPPSGATFRSEVRRYEEVSGEFVEQGNAWDADAYLSRMTVGSDGFLYMLREVGLSNDADRIVKLEPDGFVVESRPFERNGTGEVVENVAGIAVADSGDVYISSNGTGPSVTRWVLDDQNDVFAFQGEFTPAAGDDPVAARGLAVDGASRVFLAMQDSLGGATNAASIRILNSRLDPLESYAPSGDDGIKLPTAIAVGADGDVWYVDEIRNNSDPAARIGVAGIDYDDPVSPLRITPRGVVQRAGRSQIFRVKGVPAGAELVWESNLGSTRPLTPLGDIVRFVAGATIGSGPLKVTARDAQGNTLASAQVTVALTQFMTHGFSVPFGTIGQDGSSADYDLATGGGYVWVALNDSLNVPAVERYPVGNFSADGREAFFCPNGTAPSCYYDTWSPGANVAADADHAYWLVSDSFTNALYRASHSAQTGQKDTFTLPSELSFNGALAAGGPPVGIAEASVYAVASRGGEWGLARIDLAGGALLGIEENIVPFGPSSPPRHLAVREVEDDTGAVEGRIVVGFSTGQVEEFTPSGMGVAGITLPEGLRDLSVGPDGILYVATKSGSGSSERSTVRVFNLDAGDGAPEIDSLSDYQFASETGGIDNPRLVRVEALAVDPSGTILVADDITWCEFQPKPCDDGCGFGTLAAFVSIRPDGTVVVDPDTSCP